MMHRSRLEQIKEGLDFVPQIQPSEKIKQSAIISGRSQVVLNFQSPPKD